MNTDLLFEFKADKNKTITVTREFDADLDLVWKCWTDPETLEQWIAPKPWRAETKAHGFQRRRLLALCDDWSKGEKHWSRYDYQKLNFKKK
ncbi:MAG: SRPBCC domain-containing protein [Saprospiraceae bacterium]